MKQIQTVAAEVAVFVVAVALASAASEVVAVLWQQPLLRLEIVAAEEEPVPVEELALAVAAD